MPSICNCKGRCSEPTHNKRPLRAYNLGSTVSTATAVRSGVRTTPRRVRMVFAARTSHCQRAIHQNTKKPLNRVRSTGGNSKGQKKKGFRRERSRQPLESSEWYIEVWGDREKGRRGSKSITENNGSQSICLQAPSELILRDPSTACRRTTCRRVVMLW